MRIVYAPGQHQGTKVSGSRKVDRPVLLWAMIRVGWLWNEKIFRSSIYSRVCRSYYAHGGEYAMYVRYVHRCWDYVGKTIMHF